VSESIVLGDLRIAVTRKAVKNVHLSVYPPEGRVTLVAPTDTRLEVARAYAITRLDWIRTQQARLLAQARETQRSYVERETHYLWGQPYLLSIVERDAKPAVTKDHRRITLTVRPGTAPARRAEIMNEWHRLLLHAVVPGLIAQWEARLGVKVSGYFLQRMKTRWGGCNHRAGNIRLNTELVKKPKDLLEYVVVHEMIHLLEPTHSERFVALLTQHYPTWREARMELNELPLGAEVW
jgi:predicted metal-dependent hydrolase